MYILILKQFRIKDIYGVTKSKAICMYCLEKTQLIQIHCAVENGLVGYAGNGKLVASIIWKL